MTAYLFYKYVHIVGACVLLGTGAGIAFFMLLAHQSQKPEIIWPVARIVVIADFVFTTTAVILQPITGYLLIRQVGYSLGEGWVLGSLILYGVTGAFWLPVVWMQIRMRDLARDAAQTSEPLPEQYHSLSRRWFVFGFPAFFSVLLILWLMIARPAFSF
jgi:uncharacterized membrane protein